MLCDWPVDDLNELDAAIYQFFYQLTLRGLAVITAFLRLLPFTRPYTTLNSLSQISVRPNRDFTRDTPVSSQALEVTEGQKTKQKDAEIKKRGRSVGRSDVSDVTKAIAIWVTGHR